MSNLKPVQLTPFRVKYTDVLRSRSAFTLLEVILALAILAGAMAILGEIVRMSGRLASDATNETRAQLFATSLMDQMLTGHLELTQQSDEPLEVEDSVKNSVDWIYSVTFESTEIDSLASVEVLVEQDLDKKFHPVKYRLVRWVPSDSISEDQGEEPDEETEAESSDTSKSSKSSKSSEGDDG